ncbi:heavy metal translocating P-type ATPase [Pantanalinema rosaneae CENA516]|uniref:heavy metal translocating P-type ATPase n=1 Tax=Pantanalinema rosaneae TaxID=1620701 RepID=UPI003D6F5635
MTDHPIDRPERTTVLLCQVVHHIPGRIRLQISLLAQSPPMAARLNSWLTGIPGIISVRINLAARSLIIQYQTDHWMETSIEPWLSQQLLNHLQNSCQPYPLAPPTERSIPTTPGSLPIHPSTPSDPSPLATRDAAKSATDDGQWSSLRLPATAALLAVLCRLPPLVSLRPFAIVTVLTAALPVAQRALYSLFVQRRLNIDCLDLLALSLSGWQGKLFTPAMVITLHELGDVIREQTARSTEVRTANLLDAIGHFAWVKSGDQPPHQIESDRVQIGDTVVVYPGEQIPVDGTVIQGEAIIDQQSLTGESMPVVRQIGQQVFASTLVQSGQLYLRADRVGRQTRAAASIELLQKAPVYDTRMANYAEKVADRLIVPSLLLASLVLVTTRDPARAAAILTLDFVTGIRVSIPTALLGALNHTTRHGVLVRSGRTLEQLADVDTIVFDKTGTLTQGTIAVTGVNPIADMPAETVLQLAAAAEQRLNHPVAAAIVQYAQQQHLPIPIRGEWHYEVGLGVQASIENRDVLVGSERFLQQAGVVWEAGIDAPDRSQSLIYVACDGQLQGVIAYADPLRPESDRLLHLLQQTYGIEVHLLTGDNAQRASQVAQELGIARERVYAEAFPEQKARIVRDLHRSGRTVAFVGDGLNDSVALAYADVSVSFAQGSEIARETADVVLMNNYLLDLLEAIAIARQTRSLIEQNTTLVVAPNLLALGLATTVGLNPLAATAIHNGSAIAAGMNSLRPLVQHQMQQASDRK